MYNERRWHAGHWIRLGFLVVFAVFVAAMIYYMFTYGATAMPAGSVYWFPFGWLWIFFGFFLFFGLLRFAFWGPRWGYYRHYGYGNYGRENEAYHILRERYARGEITKDQYDAMMRDLYQQQSQQPAPPRY
jgi:putative membrane protein